MTARHIGISGCILAALLLLLSLFGSGGAISATAAPTVSEAWVRLPAAAGRPGAGYLVVSGKNAADALVAASAAKADRVEIHSMAMVDGVMRMRAEPSLPVPANGKLMLAPGGNHLMLFGLDPALKPGDQIAITLTFASGAKVEARAQARSAAGQPQAAAQAPAKPGMDKQGTDKPGMDKGHHH